MDVYGLVGDGRVGCGGGRGRSRLQLVILYSSRRRRRTLARSLTSQQQCIYQAMEGVPTSILDQTLYFATSSVCVLAADLTDRGFTFRRPPPRSPLSAVS